jgi:hypothetical protein
MVKIKCFCGRNICVIGVDDKRKLNYDHYFLCPSCFRKSTRKWRWNPFASCDIGRNSEFGNMKFVYTPEGVYWCCPIAN